MKSYTLIFYFSAIALSTFGQNIQQKYFALIIKADSLYRTRKYKESAFEYSSAFKSEAMKISAEDRYNAACSWAMANYSDSAYFQLELIATKQHFTDIERITTDSDLNSLHNN